MKKDSFMKDALILFAITLVAGICLGGVYEITKGPIAEANMAAKKEAYQVVYADAANFAEAEELDEAVAASEGTMVLHGMNGVLVEEVVKALDGSGNTIGYVINATSKNGYGGSITVSVGISADGTVQGIEFLSISETAGLGMNADTPDFKSKYAGKQVDEFVVVKSGASADYEIDAIGGATITTNAVTQAVNAAVYFVADSIGQ